MADQSNSDQFPDAHVAQNSPLPDELKNPITTLMTEMMTSFKQDLLTEFEDYFFSQEFDTEMPSTTGPEQDGSLTVANAVDNYITAEAEAPPLPNPFAELAAEFTIADQTGPAVDDQLANLVSELCKHQLPKAKLDAVLEKYRRPENCTNLVAPKVNTVVWQQLRQTVHTADSAMQRCQKLILASVYAMLQACAQTTAEARPPLIHALVLAMSGNREINLRRRDFLRPHLNAKYAPLCNLSTPITTELFGDDINKEIDQLTKASQLSNRLTSFRRGRGSRFHPYAATTMRNTNTPRAGESQYPPRSFQAFFGDRSSYRRRLGARVSATQSKKPQQ